MYMKDRDGEISCAYIGSKLKILIDRETSRLYIYILIYNFCYINYVSELPYIAPYCPIYCVELVKKTGYERKNEKEKKDSNKTQTFTHHN